MKVFALIPARGGSKGVPGKNIAIIDGKPLLSYTIEAALNSSKITEICVSSDDDSILSIARQYPKVSIHHRSQVLSSDSSPVTDTLYEILRNKKESFNVLSILQPTSPIRTGHQIDEAIALLVANLKINSVISVVPMNDIHPARMYWKSDNDLYPILQEYEQTRRQDIPIAYYRNGAIYLVRTNAFLEHGSVMAKPSIGYEMPISQLLNIDEPRDLLIAESLISAWKKGTL